MEYACNMYAMCLGSLWNVYAICTQYVWNMYEYARKNGIKQKPKIQLHIDPTSLHVKTPSTPTLKTTPENPYKTTPTPQKIIQRKGLSKKRQVREHLELQHRLMVIRSNGWRVKQML